MARPYIIERDGEPGIQVVRLRESYTVLGSVLKAVDPPADLRDAVPSEAPSPGLQWVAKFHGAEDERPYWHVRWFRTRVEAAEFLYARYADAVNSR